MLLNTFQHLDGFSFKKEKLLWKQRVFSWNDFEKKVAMQLTLFQEIQNGFFWESRRELEKENVDYFIERLPPSEYFRVAYTFPKKTLFIDIETTGLSRFYDLLTVVGWSMDDRYEVLLKNGHDSFERLYEVMNEAKCIVTFNGTLFDLPFLRKEFTGINIPKCHIDLRFFGRRMGFSGGQKIVEEALNFGRPEVLNEFSGEEAVVQWHRYRQGDMKAIRELITYNYFDVQGLRFLFEKISRNYIKSIEFPINRLRGTRFYFGNRKPKFSLSSKRKDFILLRSYKGLKGPKITIKDLPGLKKGITIVGIDLTGSEIRPSGFCVLKNRDVTTSMIATNQELIEQTVKAKPTIVSIDSPLSLPAGRKTPFDDDPGRKQFGIMRECERVLKRRGVSVYPCLIPSMQRLTERGIMLAKTFRGYGIPIIESYPGAAQDILGIPRKRTSMEYLIKGLRRFGVIGHFGKRNVTHDELDAITSAIVGYFFWSGWYEGLGNIDEEYLIIPSIDKNFIKVWDRVAIGFSGSISAGKTTSATYLRDKGLHYTRFSLVLKDLLEAQGREVNRSTLQDFGEKVNEELGQRWLDKTLVSLLPSTGPVVIDGLRFPEDHAFFREAFGPKFIHIHLQCELDLRRERYYYNEENKKPFEEAISHPVERNSEEMIKLADKIIDNSDDLLHLETELDKILKTKKIH